MTSTLITQSYPKRKISARIRLRWSALLEIFLFLGCALSFDFYFGAQSRFAEISPHPFWVLVILMSVQYGSAEGILAACLCSAALLVDNMPEQTLTQDRYQYLMEILTTPLLWLVSAVILGELRVRQVDERNHLRDELAQSQEREETIAKAYDQIKKIRESLEKRLAGHLRTSISTYQAIQALEKNNPEDLLNGLPKLIETVLGPKRFSIYTLKDNHLELSMSRNWGEKDPFHRQFAETSTIYQEVIGRQRPLCIVNAQDEQILQGQGLIAGPLLDTHRGEVFGMLKIEEMTFANLNLTTIETFRVLSEWIGMAYANAKDYTIAQRESVVNVDNTLLSHNFFSRQSAFLQKLAQRVGFNVSVLVVSIDDAEDMPLKERNEAAALLNRAVQGALRHTDQAFDCGRDGAEFAIILPNTPVENVHIVTKNIKKHLKDVKDTEKAKVQYSFDVYPIYEVGAS